MADANDTPAKKCCSKCQQLKPVEEFFNCSRRKDGKQAWCKGCAYAASKKTRAGMVVEINAAKRARYASDPGYAEKARQRAAAYRLKHPEKAARSVQSARAKNPEKYAEHMRHHYERNKEELKARAMAYYLENKVALRPFLAAASMRRAAKKALAIPAWADHRAIRAIYEEAAKVTKETGVRHNVDHIVPLQSKKVCGLHCEANLRILERIENISKGNRFWPDMW